MKTYTFPRGGLQYEDPFAPKKDEVVNAFLPSLSVIPLGESKKGAYPIVTMGELVKEGMLIGRASGNEAANVHASVPGRVIRKVSWRDRDGIENEALIVKMEGAFDKLGRREDIFQWNGLSGYDLQRIISELGIVEMENAGRPLAEMISASRKEEKITLVVRCVFDDPWLVADYALCRERMNAVIEGAAIVAKACKKTAQIIFAVSHPEKELGEELLSQAAKFDIPSSLVLTGSRYPQRNSRELQIALRIYEKKEGLSLGSFLILGPGVLAAAYDAVVHKKPILDRYVAVGGSAIKRPQIMKVRIGTRIGEIIDQCGGFTEAPQQIINGSPLSGREVLYLDEPVGKTCYAIVVMSKTQAACHKQLNCINCGECRAVCPVGLDPQNIYKRIRALEIDNVWKTGCHGCGCCKIVCPSALPLLETILEGKHEAASA
ncbi:MAG: SLBB domain-containing protein [Treponema sp.]|jgi:electron transport complex protein RnfC|nr:SLBB domain-containing protein [Treponema sp.]